MDIYIPDVLLDDYERMAQMRLDRKHDRNNNMMVLVHANVLRGLIRTYREARAQYLQKQTDK